MSNCVFPAEPFSSARAQIDTLEPRLLFSDPYIAEIASAGPRPHDNPAVTAVGNLVFVNGGIIFQPDRSVDVYDARRGTWTTIAPNRSTLFEAKPLVVGTKLYFGPQGIFRSARRRTYTIPVFDTATWSWSSIPLPAGASIKNAAAVGGKLIFAGGATTNSPSVASGVVSIYDTVTGQWSSATLSQARTGISVAVVNGKAIFAGGATNAANSSNWGALSNAVDIYDSATGTWSTATLSNARFGAAVAVVGGKAIFAGGMALSSQHSHPSVTSAVDVYDSNTGQWTSTTLSAPRAEAGVAVIRGKAIFAGGGGIDAFGDLVSTSAAVDVYSSKTGTWTSRKLSVARTPAVAVLGKLALFAGESGFSNHTRVSNVVDAYDSSTGRWFAAPQLSGGGYGIGGASVHGIAFFAGGGSTANLFSQSPLSTVNQPLAFDAWTHTYRNA